MNNQYSQQRVHMNNGSLVVEEDGDKQEQLGI